MKYFCTGLLCGSIGGLVGSSLRWNFWNTLFLSFILYVISFIILRIDDHL